MPLWGIQLFTVMPSAKGVWNRNIQRGRRFVAKIERNSKLLLLVFWLGIEKTCLDNIPGPPDGALFKQVPITPAKFRLKTDNLAPKSALAVRITGQPNLLAALG